MATLSYWIEVASKKKIFSRRVSRPPLCFVVLYYSVDHVVGSTALACTCPAAVNKAAAAASSPAIAGPSSISGFPDTTRSIAPFNAGSADLR